LTLATDAVIPEDMVMVERSVLDLCEKLKQNHQFDAWFANIINLQVLSTWMVHGGKGIAL